MKVRIKKLSELAVIPKYAKQGDAGMDMVAISMKDTDMYIEYKTGIAMEIPEGYVALLFPRSSLSNYDLSLANHVGVVDSGYRGEISFRFKKTGYDMISKYYEVGDKIGQIVILPYPHINFEEVSKLSSSERGSGGYGSSGK